MITFILVHLILTLTFTAVGIHIYRYFKKPGWYTEFAWWPCETWNELEGYHWIWLEPYEIERK